MRKFVRPALITLFAAAIVLAAAVFAASRSSTSDYTETTPAVEFVRVAKSVPAPYDIALKGTSQGAPLRLAAPQLAGAKATRGAVQIARVGSISLFVPNVDKAIAAVSAIARAQTGDVLSLDDTAKNEQGGAPSADMELRVPDYRFEAAMHDLTRVGNPRARSISAEDLTTQIVDSAARLRNLRRTEADIAKIMDRSGSVSQILEAESQLSSVREQIETLDAQLKDMRNRVSYSTISVSLAADVAGVPAESSASAQLVSEWHAALHAVSQFTIGLISIVVWAAAFIPYLLLVALCWWLVRKRLNRTSA
jgi:hypothetical protein